MRKSLSTSQFSTACLSHPSMNGQSLQVMTSIISSKLCAQMTNPLAMCNPTILQVVMTRCKQILFSSKNLVEISKEARLASRRHVPIHMRRPPLSLKKEVSKKQKTTPDRLCLLAATSVTPLITYQKIVNSLANAVGVRGTKKNAATEKSQTQTLRRLMATMCMQT